MFEEARCGSGKMGAQPGHSHNNTRCGQRIVACYACSEKRCCT